MNVLQRHLAAGQDLAKVDESEVGRESHHCYRPKGVVTSSEDIGRQQVDKDGALFP